MILHAICQALYNPGAQFKEKNGYLQFKHQNQEQYERYDVFLQAQYTFCNILHNYIEKHVIWGFPISTNF